MPPRAISDEQKLARQQTILATAWTMFQETDYTTVTMAGIAERLGLAKGTMYLYFPTKEEMFLAIMMDQLAAWFDEMDGDLSQGEMLTPEDVAMRIVSSLAVRPGLSRLLAILSTVLEQNVSYEAALGFKQRLGVHLARTGALLEDRVAMLPLGAGARFLLRLHALIVGLYHLAAPAPVVQQVLARPEMQGFIVDFDAELSALITTLLK
ncbi:MAG: TetR family transcriptional regulator [Anaerolineales bacterium]|nr:TetR family transcriptional regulator [Anaerolineales bacterium]